VRGCSKKCVLIINPEKSNNFEHDKKTKNNWSSNGGFNP